MYSKGIESDPHIFATRCRRPLIFQTINSVGSKVCLKYQKFTRTPSSYKDIGSRKLDFVAKTRLSF